MIPWWGSGRDSDAIYGKRDAPMETGSKHRKQEANMAAVKSVGVTGQTPEGAHYYYSGFITRMSKCPSQVFQIKSPADNISAGTPRYAANINNIL